MPTPYPPPALLLRLLVATAALFSLLGALFPEIALVPLGDALRRSRNPTQVVAGVRWLGIAGALILGLLAWRIEGVGAFLARHLGRLHELPPTRFWTLTLLLGLALRVPVAWIVPYELVTDGLWYHLTAASLAAGDGLAIRGEPTAYRFPGYPFLLSLTYRLFGPHQPLAWFWGLLSTGLILFTLHRVGRHLYSERTARLAVLLACIHPALVLYTGTVMSDLPFTAGVLLWTWGVLRGNPSRLAVAIGLGLGAAALAYLRGPGLGLILMAPLLWRLRGWEWRRLIIPSLLLAASALFAVTPWIARNQAIFGIPTFGTNLGVNAWRGNHPGAGIAVDFDSLPAEAVQQTVKLNEAEWSRLLLDATLRFIRESPGEALALLPKKLVQLYVGETEVVTLLFQGPPTAPPGVKFGLLGICQFTHLGMLLLLLGRLMQLRDPRRRPQGAQWSGWLLAGFFTAVSLAFFGSDRFRLPFLPWLLLELGVMIGRWRDDPLEAHAIREPGAV